MRNLVILILVLIIPELSSAKLVRDTIQTRQNDLIFLSYDLSVSDDNVTIRLENEPRIKPSESLRKECDGDLSSLKVVIFDRIGNFGKTKWNGLSPTAFMVPSGLKYEKSVDGFYILGEASPICFTRKGTEKTDIKFPLYVAVYEKKQTYKLVGCGSEPLKATIGKTNNGTPRNVQTGTETERIAIHTSEEIEADNEDITKALSSMQMIRQLLESETELPFSQTLQLEIYNLRSLKDRVNDADVIEKINEVLLSCNDKERELKDSQRAASLAAQAQEQALIAQQKAEEEANRQEAEEKARIQEEKRQSRNLWMIIGGFILAILAFAGNAVLKHFRDIRNQERIMQMQESLVEEAKHEATRRPKEIVRNKAHQMSNKGKTKIRETLQDSGKTKMNTKIKSI